jgi:hypothetical protein
VKDGKQGFIEYFEEAALGQPGLPLRLLRLVKSLLHHSDEMRELHAAAIDLAGMSLHLAEAAEVPL